MTKNNQAFQIAVAGEDTAAISRAQKLSRRLAAELEPELKLRSDAWRFQAFGDYDVLKGAAKRAAKADVIIVAGNSAVEPPDQVKSWIESSLSQKKKGMTAVVPLCNQEGETPHSESPLSAYLRRITVKWGMDFLTRSADGWQHNFEFSADSLAGQIERPVSK